MFDVGSLTGPLGGIIAIAYGAGAASGYAFCLRTMYKIIKAQAEKDEKDHEDNIDRYRDEVERLYSKIEEKQRQIDILQERLVQGMSRQTEQLKDSAVYLIEQGKVTRTLEDGRDKKDI